MNAAIVIIGCIVLIVLINLIFRGLGALFGAVDDAARTEQKYLEENAPSIAQNYHYGLAEEAAWERRGRGEEVGWQPARRNNVQQMIDDLPRIEEERWKALQARIEKDHQRAERERQRDSEISEILDRSLRNFRMTHDDNTVELGPEEL